MRCSERPNCHGFYYHLSRNTAPTVCRLFNASVFYWNSSWTAADQRLDVFVSETAPQRLQLFNCSQASEDFGGVCTRGMDGNTDSNFFSGHCIHTRDLSNQWWEAYIVRPAVVVYVTLYNRMDQNPWRLNNFKIQMNDVACGGMNVTTPFTVANVTCGLTGNKIRLLSLLNDLLTMCELEPYGFYVL